MVHAHRLLTTRQLHQLHTPPGEVRQDRWMQRIVAHLRDRELIASVGRHGTPRLACWYATQRGADAIEAAGQTGSRRVLVTPEGADGMLQSHTLAVNDVGIAFACWARHHAHECGPLAWEHEVAHRLGGRHPSKSSGDSLIADALLHYALNDGGRIVLIYRFVELDRATMSPHDVGAKLRRYIRYSRYVPADSSTGRPAWHDRYPGLPGVLVVVTGKAASRLRARRDMLTALCRLDPVIRDAEAPRISICLLEDLQQHGPFAAIFTRPDSDEPVDLLGRSGSTVEQWPSQVDRGAA